MPHSRFAVALHLLTLLAHEEEPPTSEYMAASVNTNPVVVRRLLATLRQAGIVASKQGPGGGWKLRRPPGQITLRDVHTLVELGTLFPLHEHPNPRCPVGRNIRQLLTRRFEAAERALHDELADTTIADLLRDVRAHA